MYQIDDHFLFQDKSPVAPKGRHKGPRPPPASEPEVKSINNPCTD